VVHRSVNKLHFTLLLDHLGQDPFLSLRLSATPLSILIRDSSKHYILSTFQCHSSTLEVFESKTLIADISLITILFRLAKTDSVQQNVLLWFDLWHSTNSYISHPCPSLQVVEVLEEIGDGSRCCKFHNIIGISSSVGSCSKPSSHVLEQLLRCSDSCDTYCYLEAWKFLMYKLTWSSLLAAIVCWFETKMG